MANDRVHIRCSGCGGWKMLMKHDGRSLHANAPIVEWLDSHGRCHPERLSADLGGNPGFTLHMDSEVGAALAYDRQNAGPPE
jgi:hypothetical protein